MVMEWGAFYYGAGWIAAMVLGVVFGLLFRDGQDRTTKGAFGCHFMEFEWEA